MGKTHLAAALAHQACRRGYDASFMTASRLLAELAGGHADRSFTSRLKRLTKPAVLVVDDFAMRDFTVSQADDFYELVCERVGQPGHSLILTSNRSPADWYPLFPNAVVGESVLDRVINSSHHLLLEGNSYRPNRRPGRPQNLSRRAPKTGATKEGRGATWSGPTANPHGLAATNPPPLLFPSSVRSSTSPGPASSAGRTYPPRPPDPRPLP